MNEEYLFEKIEDFLSGRLSEEEKQAFRARIEADPSLARQVKAQKGTHKVVDMYAQIKMKDKVRSLHQEAKAKTGTPLRKVYAIAASVAILLIVASLWNANSNYSNQSLVADNFDLPSFSNRAADDPNNNLLNQVESAVVAKDYKQAISLLSSVETSSNANMIQFYLGSLYLENHQNAKAIDVLQDLLQTGDQRYTEDVQWLLVMAHLQNNEEQQAKNYLQNILDTPGHALKQKAVYLQKELNSFWRKLVL